MRHIKRLGHAAHTSLLIFLRLAATLSFEVRLAYPQTDEAKALYKQSRKFAEQGRYSEAITFAQRALHLCLCGSAPVPLYQHCRITAANMAHQPIQS
jgi:hypothetical protein